MPPAVLSDTRTLVPAPGLPPHLPHDCEERPDRPARARPDDRARLVGIDAARGLALLGMIAVHLIDPETDDGRMSLVWSLAAGKSAALFAVLAGVSIAFMSGRRQPYRGRRLAGAVVTVLTRAALIGGLGLALGTVVPLDDAAVILVYYATLFVLAVPFLALGPRTLLVLGAVAAIGLPWLSFWLRDGMAAPPAVNLSYATLATDPAGTAEAMLLTGSYPALPWIAYVLVGMGIGRLDLRSRGAVFRIGLVGVALAGTAVLGSSLALHPLGGLRQLAAASMGSLPFDTFSELVVRGGSGTVPTTSGWWLALASPHTGTPPDLLFTIGISCAVIAGCLASSTSTPPCSGRCRAPAA